jgi:flavodoxin
MIALQTNPDDQLPPDGYGQAHTDPPEGYDSWPEYMQDISAQAHAAMATAAKAAATRLLVFKSVHHQNTARVAEAMAEVLRADCLAPADCPYERLAECKLLGIGSGIYYGRVHAELWRWVRDLPDRSGPKPAVFIFSTSGLPIFARLWHRPLKMALTRKGFSVLDEFACRGFDTWGPLWLAGGLNRCHPNEQDLKQAREFARRMVK